MDGHKEGGKFHPHSKHQSTIHASDVHQNKTKVKNIRLPSRCPDCKGSLIGDPEHPSHPIEYRCEDQRTCGFTIKKTKSGWKRN